VTIYLARLLCNFSHFLMFNHTLQLSTKTLLCPFNVGLGKTTDNGDCNDPNDLPDTGNDNKNGEDDDDDKDENLLDFLTEDDIDDSIDELEALDADAREQILTNTATICKTVTKLHSLAFMIVQSTTIALLAWHCYCKELKLKMCILSHNVITRWNSTYYMLHFTIKYRVAIDAMTADKTLKLQKFKLEMKEWAIAKELVAVLLQYKNVTLFFSQDSASVVAVIPTMDWITSNLDYQTGKAYHPSLAATVKLTHKKMDCYYSLTDSSSVYRIAMVLYLRIKLEYFHN
jgi:hypothetical protein